MTRTVLETWEELPVREDGIEQHVIDPGAPIFVLHVPTNGPDPGAHVDVFRELAHELQVRSPGALVLALPPGWCFRVVRIDDERAA